MMEHAEILHRCFRCGYCKLPGSFQDLNCPPYLKYRFESYAPGGRMWLLRAWLGEEIETSPRLSEILFSCTACGNCVEHCVFPAFKDDLLDTFTAGREELSTGASCPTRWGGISEPSTPTAIPTTCPKPIGRSGPTVWASAMLGSGVLVLCRVSRLV